VLSTSGTAPADFTEELMPLTTVSNTTHQAIEPINLSAYSGDVYIAIHVPSGGLDGYYIYLDDFTVEEIPSCTEPSALTASNITATTADLAWAAGDAETLWNVEIVDVTAAGTVTGTATNTGVTNPFTITGLTANTSYEYYVQADCGGGETSAWVGPFEFTTLCYAVTTFPWTEDFESISTPDLPSCWNYINNNSDTDFWKTFDTYGTSGSNAASLYTDYNGGNNDDYLVLPPFTLTGNERLKFSVRARSSTEPNDYRVVLSTSGTAPADFTEELMPLTIVSNTTHIEIEPINLSAYSGDVYIAIHVPSGGLDGYYIYLDDFTVEEIPSCLEPSALTASNITATTADLAWAAGDAETLWNVEIVDVTVAGTVTGTATNTGVTNPFTITGLTANTSYEYYVQADCGGGETSAWVGPFSFTTLCEATGSFVEGFESYATNVDPDCWSENLNGSSGYIYTSSSNVNTGSRALRSGNLSSATAEQYIISPSLLDMPNGTHRLKFFVYGSSSVTLEVGRMSDPTDVNTFTTVQTIPLITTHTEHVVNFNMVNTDSYFAFKMSYSSTYASVSIDDVTWEQIPSCTEPSALTATSITAFSAELGWTEAGSAASYDIEIVDITAGNSATGTASFTGVTNPYVAMSLTPDNDYEFYVRADCGAGDTSAWVGPFAFSTAIACPEPTALTASNITDAAATLGWTENGTATLYNIEIVDITAGGTFTGNATVTGVTNPYVATNLVASNDYAFYVQADCGTTNGVSTWNGPRNFTTACTAISTFPFTTDFTNNPPTDCWSEAGSGEVADGPSSLGSSDWRSGRGYTNANSDIINSNAVNLYSAVDREWLISPTYNIPGDVAYNLVVEVAVTNWTTSGISTPTDTDSMGSDDEVQLLVTTDDGATWTNLTTWNVGNQPAVTGTEFVADLSAYSGSIKFAIWASDGPVNDSEDYDFHIGKFSIVENATLAVNQVELASFKYFPNPVTNTLSLRAEQNIQNVSVFNMLGQEVIRTAPNTVSSALDMSNLQAGAYFVKVTIDANVQTVRIIKN
ncbi:choice-of-anchor J domain-containing protein, partial [Bizionia sediminis]